MEIIQAQEKDLIEVLYLLKVCIAEMNKQGLKHWNSAYPDVENIRNDIQEGMVYLLKDNGVCKGMVTLSEQEPVEYRDITWPEKSVRPLYLYRLAIHPKWQGLGLARELIGYAGDFAKERGSDCIRLDVFSQSEKARNLYEKQNFHEVAEFHFGHQKIPYVCYEKSL